MTGGTGFVGTAVVRMMIEAGHRVQAIVRRGSEDRLPHHPACISVSGDCLIANDVEHAVDGTDAVIHLVGMKRAAIKSTGMTYNDVDVASVRVMIEAMKKNGLRRLLLLSAGAIGHSVYVVSKARAERLTIEAGLDWTIFRPAFILGPGQQWPRLIQPALSLLSLLPASVGDIARRANNITREQLAYSMLYALEHPDSIGQIFDVPKIRWAATVGPARFIPA